MGIEKSQTIFVGNILYLSWLYHIPFNLLGVIWRVPKIWDPQVTIGFNTNTSILSYIIHCLFLDDLGDLKTFLNLLKWSNLDDLGDTSIFGHLHIYTLVI